MDYTIIDAHAHLWLRQDTEVNGQKIQTLDNGKSLFMGETSIKFIPLSIAV
jgi:predicted TIM-barrel fold metal-dependent hydrolase